MISPGEARDHDSDAVRTASWARSTCRPTSIPGPPGPPRRWRERPSGSGAAFYGGVKVTGLGIENGRVNAVHTTVMASYSDRTGRLRRRNLGAAVSEAWLASRYRCLRCSTSMP